MGIASFSGIMADAEQNGYAVGYFESWNMESLLAVADAAERTRSPVILGFSGISLPDRARSRPEHLEDYHALASAVARRLTVPACLLFNECANTDWISEAVRLGFGLVMFSDDDCDAERLVEQTRRTAELAHASSAAAEGEPDPLPGTSGDPGAAREDSQLTDPDSARRFAAATGVDSLAVSVGQAHLHGRRKVTLDLDRLSWIRDFVDVPLALHGATSLSPADLKEAVRRGVRKVNIGSALKTTYFEALRASCGATGSAYNPYRVLGSGLPGDVGQAAREALSRVVEEYMVLLGSAGRA